MTTALSMQVLFYMLLISVGVGLLAYAKGYKEGSIEGARRGYRQGYKIGQDHS